MSILQQQIDTLVSQIQEAKGDLAYKYSIGGLNGIYNIEVENTLIKLNVLLYRVLNYDLVNHSDSYFYSLRKESKQYCGTISITSSITTIPSYDRQYRRVFTLTSSGSGASINTGITLPSRASFNYQNILFIGYSLLTLGDGEINKESYFSSDNGVSAKLLNSLSAGDKLYINANVMGFSVSLTDQIELTLI